MRVLECRLRLLHLLLVRLCFEAPLRLPLLELLLLEDELALVPPLLRAQLRDAMAVAQEHDEHERGHAQRPDQDHYGGVPVGKAVPVLVELDAQVGTEE